VSCFLFFVVYSFFHSFRDDNTFSSSIINMMCKLKQYKFKWNQIGGLCWSSPILRLRLNFCGCEWAVYLIQFTRFITQKAVRYVFRVFVSIWSTAFFKSVRGQQRHKTKQIPARLYPPKHVSPLLLCNVESDTPRASSCGLNIVCQLNMYAHRTRAAGSKHVALCRFVHVRLACLVRLKK
jgi:hypothetical protein